MIVCLCRGVSDRAIYTAIARGAFTPDEIAEMCGVGTDCGSCCEMVEEILTSTGAVAHDLIAGRTA